MKKGSNTISSVYKGSTVIQKIYKSSIPVMEKEGTPYTPIEYLQNTGTGYINTGYKPNHNTKLVITLSNVTGTNGDATVFGETWATNRFLVTIYNNSYRYFYKGEHSTSNITNKYTLSFYRGTVIRNGITLREDNSINSSVSFTNNLSLFCATSHVNSSLSKYSKYKLYACSIYDDNVLVRDYIPVKDKNGVVCLYDKVNQNFVYSANGQSFVGGQEI